jgi:hypothetical protein
MESCSFSFDDGAERCKLVCKGLCCISMPTALLATRATFGSLRRRSALLVRSLHTLHTPHQEG